MTFEEAVKAVEKKDRVTYWWESDYFQKRMGAQLKRAAEDPNLLPAARILPDEEGQQRIWHYLADLKNDGKALIDGTDSDPFDISWMCPPNYPPGGPPCP